MRAGGCRRDERTERVEEREAGDGKSGGWEDRIAPAHVQLIFDRLDGVIRRFTICIGHENMSRPHILFCSNLSSRSSVMTLHGNEGGIDACGV